MLIFCTKQDSYGLFATRRIPTDVIVPSKYLLSFAQKAGLQSIFMKYLALFPGENKKKNISKLRLLICLSMLSVKDTLIDNKMDLVQYGKQSRYWNDSSSVITDNDQS